VLLDGEPALSSLTVAAEGRAVTTIEGLMPEPRKRGGVRVTNRPAAAARGRKASRRRRRRKSERRFGGLAHHFGAFFPTLAQ